MTWKFNDNTICGYYVQKKKKSNFGLGPLGAVPQIAVPQSPYFPNIHIPMPHGGPDYKAMFPFEHQSEDGAWHLHLDNWHEFRDNLEKQYPHNWLHRRAEVILAYPKGRIEDIPASSHMVQIVEDDWSVIFSVYPAHAHTTEDPKGEGESYILLVEDKHSKPTLGPEIVFFSTTPSLASHYWLHSHMTGTTQPVGDLFAFFRNKYYKVLNFEGGSLGQHPPPEHERGLKEDKKPGKTQWRSIDDE